MAFFGVCYSPYRQGNDPPPRPVSEAEVRADLASIAARKFTHIRTYSEDSGNAWNVQAAAKHGLKVALGVWVDPNNLDATKARIDAAWKQAESQPGTVLHLVVGNEVNRRDAATWNPGEIRDAMAYARTARGRYPGVPHLTSRLEGSTASQGRSSRFSSFHRSQGEFDVLRLRRMGIGTRHSS